MYFHPADDPDYFNLFPSSSLFSAFFLFSRVNCLLLDLSLVGFLCITYDFLNRFRVPSLLRGPVEVIVASCGNSLRLTVRVGCVQTPTLDDGRCEGCEEKGGAAVAREKRDQRASIQATYNYRGQSTIVQ